MVVGCVLACTACGRISFDATSDAGTTPIVDAPAVTDPYGMAILADGPVAYWRFEERSGTTVRDHIAGHIATLTGGCTLDVAGALTDTTTRAVDLDGTCRIAAGDILDFASSPFTIELWASIDVSNSSVRWLVSHMDRDKDNDGYALSFQDMTLWVEHNNGGGAAYIPALAPPLGAYHHVAYTFRNGQQRIHVDGLIVTEQPFIWTQPSVTAPLVFGDFLEENPNKYDGRLDEVVFYDRELSQAELTAHIGLR